MSTAGALGLPAASGARRSNQSGDAARQRAMEAAIEAIADVGADRVRMSDIATRAGMSTGHILYHFGRKDRLLIEVLRWSEQDLTSRLVDDLAHLRSPLRRLEHFVSAYLPSPSDTQRWALWTQVTARPPQDLETRQLLDSFAQTWEALLTDIVREGQSKRVFTGVDVPEFVLRSRAMLDGLAMEVMTGSLRLDFDSARAFAFRAMSNELS